MNTFALLTADDGAFIVDLESVQRFDRLMLRWNQRNNLRGRPNHIRIEVSNDNNLLLPLQIMTIVWVLL